MRFADACCQALFGVTLSDEELQAFRDDVDEDGNGEISMKEFAMAINQHLRISAAGPQHQDAADLDDGSGGASGRGKGGGWSGGGASKTSAAADSVWGAVLERACRDPRGWHAAVSDLFARFDGDGDGNLDVSELARGFRSIGVQVWQ